MIKKHKQYSKPKTPFDKARIDEEAQIKKEFGLKNKKEIWKANARISHIREKAKKLIPADDEDKKVLYKSLEKIGLEVSSIAEILSLDKKDYLKRRLQTVLYNKNLAKTIKGSRQMIVHKKVLVNGKVVNKPSYIVSKELENKITVKKDKVKKKVVKEKTPEEVQKEPQGEHKNE